MKQIDEKAAISKTIPIAAIVCAVLFVILNADILFNL